MPGGATPPNQVIDRKSGIPDSANVGTFGHIDVAGDDVGERRPGTAIGHVRHPDLAVRKAVEPTPCDA